MKTNLSTPLSLQLNHLLCDSHPVIAGVLNEMDTEMTGLELLAGRTRLV